MKEENTQSLFDSTINIDSNSSVVSVIRSNHRDYLGVLEDLDEKNNRKITFVGFQRVSFKESLLIEKKRKEKENGVENLMQIDLLADFVELAKTVFLSYQGKVFEHSISVSCKETFEILPYLTELGYSIQQISSFPICRESSNQLKLDIQNFKKIKINYSSDEKLGVDAFTWMHDVLSHVGVTLFFQEEDPQLFNINILPNSGSSEDNRTPISYQNYKDNKKISDKDTLLLQGILNNDLGAIENAMDQGANINCIIGENNFIQNSFEKFNKFFSGSQQNDPKQISAYPGLSPLMLAINFCNKSVVEMLIRTGANVNFIWKKGNEDITPMDLALLLKRIDLLDIFYKTRAEFTIDLGTLLNDVSGFLKNLNKFLKSRVLSEYDLVLKEFLSEEESNVHNKNLY